MARLAHVPNAGDVYLGDFVRRGLQEAGFTMQKPAGFGRKREMLCGVMGNNTSCRPFPRRGFCRSGSENVKAAIIGGGIAARCYHWRYCVAAGR